MFRSIQILLAGVFLLNLVGCASSKLPRAAKPYSGAASLSQPRTASRPPSATAGAPPASSFEAKAPSTAAPSAGPGELVPATIGVPPSPSSTSTYRIGPKDLLRVEVFQVAELSSQERVSDDGDIVMPLIGAVRVAGLTPKEAEDHVARLLEADYLQNPQVNIFVEEFASQKVTVSGSVEKPGVFPLQGRTTLTQAVALAGGLTDLADNEQVILFRGQGTPTAQAYVIDVDQIDEGALEDPLIIGDDRVFVPKSGSAVFVKRVSETLRGFVNLSAL
jgi:polysaccharide biosynthesis/export protein